MLLAIEACEAAPTRCLAGDAAFDGEPAVSVFGTQSLQKYKGSWWVTGLSKGDKRFKVAPGRLNSPRAVLPAQQLGSNQTIGLGFLGHALVALDQCRFLVGVNVCINGGDNFFGHVVAFDEGCWWAHSATSNE